MQSTNRPSAPSVSGTLQPHGATDRDAVAEKLAAASELDKGALASLMTDARQDENLFAGLELHLNRQAAARFLHTMNLEALGEWLGHTAPDRLQVRLMEIAKSSHHPAFQAFRTGVLRSGGLARAFPKA